jgi:hypothetical protein
VQSNRVDGLAEAYAMLARLPEAAQEQIGVEMAIIGRDVLAAQKRDVAKATGQLEAGPVAAVADRAAPGEGRACSASPGGRAKLFYGRIVEGGRRAQTVIVQRAQRRLPDA